jgi:oligopeptide transport system substrate-binding protein
MKKLMALVLCISMLLVTAAGCARKSSSGSSDSNYRKLYSSELTTLNYLVTGSENEQAVAANCVDTLVEYDKYGVIHPALAESWENKDEVTWTFHLRKGVKWVDSTGKEYAEVKAQDFVDAAKYLLNQDNKSETASAFYSVVKNAEEYYNKEITDFSQVGVKALDDYTLEYTLKKPTTYFLSMLTYVCFMPVNGQFLEEQASNFGVDNTAILYNGAYILKTFDPQRSHVYVKNDSYWDKDNVYIEKITETYNKEAETLAPEMYKRGEIDYTTLSADILDDWLKNEDTKDIVTPQRTTFFSFFYAFNFDPQFDEKYEPENWKIAVNNENFRKSIFYGLDRAKAMAVSQPENPESLLFNTITPPQFTDLNGTDYTQIGDLKEISNTDPFQESKAKEYAEKAKEELIAAGATLPVKILMPYNPGTANWDKESQVVEQQLENLLGKDYIDIIPEAGPKTGFLSAVRRSGKYALMKCNWGPDYADPETYTDPFNETGTYNKPQNVEGYTDSNGKKIYTNLLEAAKQETTDVSARYTAFAKAEAFLINHAFVIPYGHSATVSNVTKINPFEEQYSPSGVSVLKYKGQHLLDHPLSLEEYNKAAEEWENKRQAALQKAGE